MALLKSRTITLRQQRRGLIRVLVYFAFVTTVCGAFGLRHARAEFGDQTLDLGREMAELAVTSRQELTSIVFNGQKIRIGSAVTEASVDAVLARYEEYCKSSASAIFAEGSDGPRDPTDVVKTGFVRLGGGAGEGAVICFVKGALAKATREEAIREFARTGRLGAIGELRYVYAKRNPKKDTTLVLTAWTDDSFNLLEVFPRGPTEDVRGEDFAEVPRVPNSVRTLATRAEGTPFAANVYRTADAPEKVIAFYDHELQDHGWFMVDPEMTEQKDGAQARGYVKDGVVVTLTTTRQEDGTYAGLGLSGVSATTNDQKRGELR